MNHEAFSRRLNARCGGSPAEMTCWRLHRNRPFTTPLVWAVDAYMVVRYAEAWGHCARIAEREIRRRRGVVLRRPVDVEAGLVDWLRRGGWL